MFVGEVDIEDRRNRELGPYSGGRVRSSIETFLFLPTRIERGRRTDHFTVEPSTGGWRIDVESADIDMSAFRECDGHSADFTELSEQAVTVKVISRTVSEPWVNCKVDVTIRFDEVRFRVGTRTVETEEVTLTAGSRTLLELDDEIALDKPRLAHVEIESNSLSRGRIVVRRGEKRSGVSVEEEAVGGRGAYVEVDWVGER